MMEIPGFEILRQLGRGATAQVYLAIRVSDGKKVALKIFHPGLWDQLNARRRAFQEFQALSHLHHPKIVRVLDPLWELDPPVVVMEYVDGFSLQEVQTRLPYVLPEVAVLLAIEILDALETAHERGVIHRDIKPANILVSKEGGIFVTDFGLAKVRDMTQHTMTGAILGSPDYMSPEQARGDVIREKSDLFSVAAILYFLVTGTPPFSRHSPLATLAAVAEANPEPAHRRNPKLSTELSALIHRGLAKDPQARYATASEFKLGLRNYLESLGLSSDSFTFPLWMESPSESTLQALKTITFSLIQRTETLIAQKKWDASLETISLLGQVAPDCASLPRLMTELSEARRRRGFAALFHLENPLRIFAATLAATLVGSLLLGFIFLNPRTETATIPEPVPSKFEVKAEASPAQPTSVVLAAAPAVAEPPVPKPKPLTKKKKETLRGKVKFDVAEEIRVFWDGKPVPPNEALLSQRLGLHQLRLEKPGAKPIQQEILVEEKEPTVIRVR
jgi:serine/threonine protein kinase